MVAAGLARLGAAAAAAASRALGRRSARLDGLLDRGSRGAGGSGSRSRGGGGSVGASLDRSRGRRLLGLLDGVAGRGRSGGTVVTSAVAVALLAVEVGGVVGAGVGPGSRSVHGVRLRGRVVDVDVQTGLSAVIGTGELHGRAGSARATALDVELSAADVELRTANLAGGVETDVLGTEEVLARGELGGQGEGEVLDTGTGVGSPLETLGSDLRGGELVDLEPVTVTGVLGGGAGGLGHVDGLGSRVANLRVDGETDLVTGLDGHGASSSHDLGVAAALVAGHVRGGDILDGAVGVGRAADVLVRAGGLAVDDESLEVVVGQSTGHEASGGGEKSGKLDAGMHDVCM